MMKNIIIIAICIIIYSCQNELDNEFNGTDKAESGITILIKGVFLKDTILHKDGGTSKNLTPVLTYSGVGDVILPISKISKSDSLEAIKIVKPQSFVILQRKIGFDDFDFIILQPGDSVELSLSNSDVYLMNRKALKYDLGLTDLNKDLPISRSESYNRNRLFLLELTSSEEQKLNVMAKHKKNVEKAKKYYQELLIRIDSVYHLKQMSKETYDVYKTYYTYKGKDGAEILDQIESLSSEEQDSIFKYSFFRDPLFFQYSRFGYKDITFASGRGVYDYRVVMDSVFAHSNKLGVYTRDLLLYEFMGRLAESGVRGSEVKAYFEKFRKSVQDTTLVKAISANFFFDDIQMNSKNIIALMDKDGKKTNLRDVLSTSPDSIFYIDFWASWCAPCIAEMPASKELKQDVQDMPIGIVYLSIDQKIENWKKSASRIGLDAHPNNYVVVNKDASQFLQDINLVAIPRYLVLNKEGKLLQSKAPSPSSEEIRKVLESLLSVELN